MMRRVLIIASAMAALQCGPTNLGSVETTNGAVAVVRHADGSPAAGARVRIIDRLHWFSLTANNSPVVAESLLTDTYGQVRPSRPLPEAASIEVQTGTEALFRLDFSLYRIDTLVLEQGGSINGALPSGIAPSVVMSGTTYRAIPDSSTGLFSFINIPAGIYALLCPAPDAGNSRLLVGRNVTVQSAGRLDAGTLSPGDTLWLSDFHHLTYETPLRPITGGGNWYGFDDAMLGGISSAVTDFDTAAGVFRLNAILRQGQSTSVYCGTGVFLGNQRDSSFLYCNLSHLRALAFRARGDRALTANFSTFLMDSIGTDWNRFGHTVQLTDTWQDFVIPVDSLKTSTPGFSWAQASTRSHILNFTVVPRGTALPESTTVWLDSVRLVGISADQLMQK
jgi:hypothetical protein